MIALFVSSGIRLAEAGPLNLRNKDFVFSWRFAIGVPER
jgi:hypothetical protein